MAITGVGWGTTSTGTTGTVFPPWPTGHQAGDLGIAFVETSGDTPASLNLARGFAFLGSSVSAGSGALTRLDVYWGVATSSSMSPPVFNGQADHQWATMGAWRNASTSSSFITANTGGSNTLATTVTMPSVTTINPGSLVIAAAAYSADSGSNIVNPGDWSNSNGNAVTPTTLFGTTAGDGGGCAIGWFIQPSAGASGTTSTITALSCAFAPMTIVVNPPAATNQSSFLPFFI